MRTMALSAGARLGPYEIVEQLASLETGDLYKASDTRLNRTVALKVLPPYFSGHPEMRERLEREARTIASLNHPNICTLHDIGQEDPSAGSGQAAVDFLVLEYLEGETLAERLTRGALPLDEALTLAREVADALDKAHAQGVVHRGLKPSNIMLTANGTKLLDFGLARWSAPHDAAASASMAPTRAASAVPGAFAGPVDYMSPEQLEGHEGDARTDIFALGVVIYEAVTGRKAFEGKTRTILIASILTGDPDPMPDAPAALEHTVRRCLEKDPEERWQTAHDLALQIQWIAGDGGVVVPAATAARQRKRERLGVAVAAALVLFTAVLATPAISYLRAPAPEAFEYRAPLVGLSQQDIAISPDGSTIAAVLRPGAAAASALYLRPAGAITSRRLAGTDDAAQPFWSPDGRFVAFVAGGKLRKVEAAGGPVQDVTAAADFAGGAWSARGEGLGTIVFGSSKGLFRVSAEGGAATPLTTVEKNQAGHFWPEFLPDGVHYVYLAWSGDSTNRALFTGALDAGERPARLMAAESNASYAPPGHLLFHREATLFAQPFNANSLETTGDAIQVAGGVSFNASNGRGDFDASQEGTLIYFQGQGGAATPRGGRAGVPANNVQYAWVRRTGGVIEAAGAAGPYGDFDLSPDEKFIAVTRQEAGAAGADIWIIDWQRAAVANPLTFDPADDVNPVFSPDGSQVAFTSYRKGNADVYVRRLNGVAGSETPLVETPANESVEAWSRDGHIAYLVEHDNVQDIYARPVQGDGKAFAVVTGPFRKNEPQFSFDGKWLAYAAETGGTFQVWVTSFPKADQFVQISNQGGGQPRWRRDGKELFYRDPGGAIVAVSVAVTADGKITLGPPAVQNAVPMNVGASATDPSRHQMAVSADGQRFLFRVAPGSVAGARGTGGRRGLRGGAGSTTAPRVIPFTADTVNNIQFRGGRVGRGGLAYGLTVVRHWTSALGTGGK
jgi:Tol biopolymer transport system component/tRNA A-37 threonylcarbamoyl transferase component Bud32